MGNEQLKAFAIFSVFKGLILDLRDLNDIRFERDQRVNLTIPSLNTIKDKDLPEYKNKIKKNFEYYTKPPKR